MKLLALVTLVSAASAASVSPTAPAGSGPAACNSISRSLGPAKTVSNIFDLAYISSRFTYYNTRQGAKVPSCVVYPATAQDVSTTLKAIRKADAKFAIKAGGHNPNDGFSAVDQGVLIDLGRMTAKSYDATTTLATFEPGNRFGDLYKFYNGFGRTVVGGRLSGVGTGLALGGGLSYLSGQYGMAADSFRELQVVLPSGAIVKTSPTVRPDLFFAMRGGGGNAYGIVTRYTVQSRPVGRFYAGNIITLGGPNADRALDAVRDFTRHNTDPKAAIIGSYIKLPTPDLALGADEVLAMFAVYDGPNPGNAFANFTAIPNVSTMKERSYPEVGDIVPYSAEISKGENTFRVSVHRVDGEAMRQTFEAWRKWAATQKGRYLITSIDFQPIARSLTDASRAQNGGNAMQMPDGPWFWANYLVTAIPGLPAAEYDALQSSFKAMTEAVPSDPTLPLFINDAAADQHPLRTFSSYARLQAIKKRYDPDAFFARRSVGWSFD